MDKTTNLFLLIATIVALLPPILIKKYNIEKYDNKYAWLYLIISGILYLILLFSYVKLFDNRELGLYYVILQILQIIIMVLIGIFFFAESTDIVKIIGIALAVISVIILSYKSK
jgi:multidrug transporter EmrE-like cation transporter